MPTPPVPFPHPAALQPYLEGHLSISSTPRSAGSSLASYPIRAPSMLLFQVRERLPRIPAPGSSWLLRQSSGASQAPLWLGASSAGQGSGHKGGFVPAACSLLHPSPAVTPPTLKISSSVSKVRRHQSRIGLIPLPPFPRTVPSQERSRLDQVFALIPLGADSRPRFCLSARNSPPTSASHIFSFRVTESFSLVHSRKIRWINYGCRVLQVCRERNYSLAEQVGKTPKQCWPKPTSGLRWSRKSPGMSQFALLV